MELTSLSAANLGRSPVQQWESVQPALCTRLGDSRRQFHHAAQLATAAGVSYLPAQADDSHTNLEWLAKFRALFSREIPTSKPFRIGVRPEDLTLLVLPTATDSIVALDLNGCTISDAAAWVKDRIDALGGTASRYTLERHYEIPTHAVANGGSFDTADRVSFHELARWFANGFLVLNDVARRTPQSSEVRCWPHHFDIGTLIRVGADRSIGIGLEPGDEYYDEPYFYLNMSPQPTAARVGSRRLGGRGSWHTNEWIGAVLPGSRLSDDASQKIQVAEFLDSALAAAVEILSMD